MTLLRDSVIVGAATFLIGSVFMGISVKQEGEPVGWWPYVGTFMSGALGFYLLGATNVVKVKNAEYKVTDGYEDCEVCAKTCDIKTDPLHDVQAGRICSDCHYLNEYGVEKGAESYSAEDVICAYCEEVIEENPTVTHGETVYHDYCAEKLIALSDGHGLHERDIAYWGAESFSADAQPCPKCKTASDYICDFCAQCKRCCETSYGCYDVALCNDCDGSFIGKDIDGCCGSCDDCCECKNAESFEAESFSAEGQISWEHENESMFTTGHERTVKNFQGIPYQISYKWELWIYEEEIDDFADDEVKRIIDESIQNCIDSFDLEHEDMEEEDFELKYESKGVDNQEMSGYTLSYDFKAYRSLGKGAESFSAEGPTDDELEMWSYREEDGSMLVSIDEEGDLHTELTYKDGDLINLKRFMAEVFEADRKARRRTTLTWARGIEPGFGTKDNGDIYFSKPRPYDNDQYYYDYQYSNDNAYHIKGLPPGFHIQLWKTPKRGHYWQAYLKSPNTDEWKEVYDKSKRNLMVEVLEWYNDVIAIPEETELSPIQQLMIEQGMISGDIQIYRIHIPAAIQKKKDKATGEVVSKTIIPEKIQYHFAGGSDAHAPTLFATYDGDLEFNTDDIPSTILHFCRGLIYIGVETAGNVRSVNRFNMDRKQWVLSHPAWFQNMCKQGIKDLHFATGRQGTYEINGIDFLRFYGSNALPEKKFVDLGNDIERPMFQVRLPIEDGEEVVDDGWITPRPSTQRKMYENKGHDGTFATLGFENEVGILNKCVAKYQPQTFDEIQNTMLQGRVTQNSDGWGLDGSAPAGHIMCRRFKKK